MASKNKLNLTSDIVAEIRSGNSDTTAAGLRTILYEILDSYLNVKDGGLLYETEVGYSTLLSLTDDKSFVYKKLLVDSLASKQDTLVSGTNIRTVNSSSLLGSTNLQVGTFLGTISSTLGLIPYSSGVADTLTSSSTFKYDLVDFIAQPTTSVKFQIGTTSTNAMYRLDSVGLRIGTIATIGTTNTQRFEVIGTTILRGASEVLGTFYNGSLVSNIISSSNNAVNQAASAFSGIQRCYLASNTSTATVGNGSSYGFFGAAGGTQKLWGDIFAEVTDIGVGTVKTSIGLRLNYNDSPLQVMYSNGTGTGFGTTSDFSRTVLPTAFVDTAASTTAKASLRIRSGVAPTAPNNGDTINVSGVIQFYDGTQWNNINRPNYLTAGVQTGLLENTSNWSMTGQYTGTAITGTFQGQKHYDTNYFFECVLDNNWIRLIRG